MSNKTNVITTTKKPPDYGKLQPYFSWLSTKVLNKTFDATTQCSLTTSSTVLCKNYRYPFPAINVSRRDEYVATSTVYSDTPSINYGSTTAQIFVGTQIMLTDFYGMKSCK